MSSVSQASSSGRSLLSNVLSGGVIRCSRAVLQIFVTPLFIFLLGVEQYGLVAFNMVLQMLFFVLDQAFSPVVVRELGILGAKPESSQRLRNLFATFERCSVVIGIVVGGLIILAAPFIAEHWLQATTLNSEKITYAIQIMGVFMMFHWPSMLYSGCFIGLHRQSVLAKITVVLSVLHSLVALGLLYFWKADILVFVGVQAVFALVTSVVMRAWLVRMMPRVERKPQFEWTILQGLAGFASGNFFVGVTAVILTQADKIFISKFETLESFSAYSLSFNVVVQVAAMISAPLMVALLPVLARLVADGDEGALAREYHKFSQMNAFVTYAFLGTLVFFAEPLIKMWLGASSPIAENMAGLVPWIVVGTMFNIFSGMPYILQISSGWIRLKLIMNICQVVLFVALLFVFYPIYGVIVGPVLWILLNLANAFIEAPLMHRRYLKGEYLRWLGRDIVVPGVVAFGIFAAGRFLLPSFDNLWLELVKICMVSGTVVIGLFLVLPIARGAILVKGREILVRVRG